MSIEFDTDLEGRVVQMAHADGTTTITIETQEITQDDVVPRPPGRAVGQPLGPGLAGIVETERSITIHSLRAGDATLVQGAADTLGWQVNGVDAGETPIDFHDLHEDLGPFRLTVQKPAVGGSMGIVTAEGLKQALLPDQTPTCGVWWIARLQTGFDTLALRLVPWGHEVGGFVPAGALKSPREIVRETSERRLLPGDIRPWLMVMPEQASVLWGCERFRVFAKCSATTLLRAVASEVVSPHEVAFSGPSRRTLPMSDESLTQRLGVQGFMELQRIARWVYEDIRSTEQRHILLAAEVARSTSAQEDLANTLRTSGNDIRHGARLAYQLGLSDLSKEAIKAQADLRKAVADDTAKAADGARSTAAGLATAIATGIGLFVARITNGASDGLLAAVALAVGVYMLVVGASSLRHLAIQNGLRQAWRQRFYRFIPHEDYREMVIEPIRQAEQVFRLIAWLCVYASEVMLAAASYLLSKTLL